MKRTIFITTIFLNSAALSDCNLSEYNSGPNKVHLVELYTSEGCSSCPPADKWMNSLITNEYLYKDFIPLKFHVDYWNYLGWKDRFSKVAYTQRQRNYAKNWGSRNIYTPEFTLNGKEWRTRNTYSLKQKHKALGELNIKKISKENYSVEFVSKELAHKQLNLNLAILGHDIRNKITRGENRGKNLSHNFVVLALKTKTLQRGKNYIKLPQLSNDYKSKSIVFWVNLISNMKPIQSAGGCL